jgi:hypothetical protein
VPERIRLSRAKGWRLPVGAVVVSRPTKWGNPFRWSDYPATQTFEGIEGGPISISVAERRRWAVVDFRASVAARCGDGEYPSVTEIRSDLAGRDLACWCPLDGPCHADVLLEVANPGWKP